MKDSASAEAVVRDAVWAQLRTCRDPEIPVNIVELGLVRKCEITPSPEGFRVAVTMTLTAPGCPVADMLVNEVREKLFEAKDVFDASVIVALDPPWDPSMMSEAARMVLYP